MTNRPGVVLRVVLVMAVSLLPGCGQNGWLATGRDAGGTVPSQSELPFRVPKGYVATRVGGPPLITHPRFASFDDRGRLYVAGSSGHNLDAKALLQDPPDVIRCLE